MLSVTAAQLDAWLAALMFPLGRLLGLFASAPVFSNRGVSVRIRLAIGLGVAMAVLPVLPPMPQVPPGGGLGLAIFAQQILIGIAIGFGAQTLVRDIVSGIFFLFDDAFRLGEYVEIDQVVAAAEMLVALARRLR